MGETHHAPATIRWTLYDWEYVILLFGRKLILANGVNIRFFDVIVAEFGIFIRIYWESYEPYWPELGNGETGLDPLEKTYSILYM